MEFAVRRFARNILLLHLALLVVVLGVVFFASRAIEQSAREQAVEQARQRQEQLAGQTAKGIEGFYQNIISDMDLLPRGGDDSSAERTALSDAGSKAVPRTPLGQRGVLIGFILARQLEDRVSHLFVLDKGDMIPHGLLREELQEELKLGKSSRPPPPPVPQPAPRSGPGRPPQGPQVRQQIRLAASGTAPTEQEMAVVRSNRDWLAGVSTQAVSKFDKDNDGGCNLVAFPLAPNSRTLVVAAVPVERIADKYLTRLSGDGQTTVFLVDENQTLMATSPARPRLSAANLTDAGDDQVKAAVAALKNDAYHGTRFLDRPFRIGDQQFAPAMVTAVRIEVVPGRHWYLLVASPASEVDRVVSSLFDRVVLWAFFVTIAVTGILVSTAVTLIRNRAKLERVRMEAIRKELDRARQIQTAWLPHTAPACRSLEVAAVNYPAQHISGDFYNWFDLPDGRTAIAIGDVTGHGMSAAFLMATTQLLVRTTMGRITDPGECLAEVNRQLCTQVFNGQFVTLQLLIVDPVNCVVEFAAAGHPPPLLVESNPTGQDTFKPLPIEPQLVLGIESDVTYDTQRLQLPVGSTLLLYTDGAADVEAPDGQRLGSDGLRRPLPVRRPGAAALDAAGLLDAVVQKVNSFRGGRALGDDLTLVAVRLKGTVIAKRPEPAVAGAVS